jgi:hypothetical protein
MDQRKQTPDSVSNYNIFPNNIAIQDLIII